MKPNRLTILGILVVLIFRSDVIVASLNSASEITKPSLQDIRTSRTLSKVTLELQYSPRIGSIKKPWPLFLAPVHKVSFGDDKKGWQVIKDTPPDIEDLKEMIYYGGKVELVEANIKPGIYKQIRLTFSQDGNRVITDKNTEKVLALAPDAQTEVKINGPFTMRPGEVVSIMLKLNTRKSFRQNGENEYIFKPTISLKSVIRWKNHLAVKNIKAKNGGRIALSDGAMLDIPPGALESDVEISLIKIPNSSGGDVVSNVYFIAPDIWQKLNHPAFLRLPYNPEEVASGGKTSHFMEADLLISVGYKRYEDTMIDTLHHVASTDITEIGGPAFVESQCENPIDLLTDIQYFPPNCPSRQKP